MMIFVAAVLWLALFCVALSRSCSYCAVSCLVVLVVLRCVLVSRFQKRSHIVRRSRPQAYFSGDYNPSHPQHEHQQVNEFWDVSRMCFEYVEGAPLSS